MPETETEPYNRRAEQHLIMAANAACLAAKKSHLNLAAQLATKSELVRWHVSPAFLLGLEH